MNLRKLSLFALATVVAVLVIPSFLPSGPSAQLDPGEFFRGGRWLLGLGVVLGGGLLTACTPCVYPLIPITVSVFGAKKAESRGKALALTLSYVVGMSLVFAVLGLAAVKTGQAFGTMLGNRWVVAGLAVFLLVLASSMFGAFELNLPASWNAKLSQVGGAGFLGAFLMGSVSGFLAAPCTGPVLSGLLLFVATLNSALLGAAILFVYGFGIGIPFLLIGAFAVQLPKSGAWMEAVKSVLGIVLVVLAVGYIRDAWPALRTATAAVANPLGSTGGAVIAAVIAGVGVLLGAVHLSFKESRRDFALKALGVAVVVLALLVRLAALNAPKPGQLWVDLGVAKAAEHPELTWHLKFALANEEDTNVGPFDAALEKAKAEGKPVMIDFFAEWCAACKELDRFTYVAPSVVAESERFVNIKVDGTNDAEAIQKLQDRFGVKGLPTVAFVSSDGKILEAPRVTGFLEAEQFLGELKKVR